MRARVAIGDFSRASHLSVKTLRHYHEVGLLEPWEVDPANGYRYYSEDQIPVAQVIRRLRDLQMPVAEVKSVLAASDPEARNRLIAGHLDRLEDDLAQTRAAVVGLRELLERPHAPSAVTHRTMPATPAIAIRETVDREDILAWWQGALGELHAIARAQGLQQAGPTGGMYASEIFQHGRGEATVFIPTEGPARAIGRVEPLVVPPAELAIMPHRGPLADADLTYGELGAHVMRHEISVEGPLREYYLVGFLDADDPDQWETEIGWPIFRSDS
jgi:DNA-binding transcriptional MerR regulator